MEKVCLKRRSPRLGRDFWWSADILVRSNAMAPPLFPPRPADKNVQCR
jgi:hypothetical protein